MPIEPTSGALAVILQSPAHIEHELMDLSADCHQKPQGQATSDVLGMQDHDSGARLAGTQRISGIPWDHPVDIGGRAFVLVVGQKHCEGSL